MPLQNKPTQTTTILVELDHMDWMQSTFSPQACDDYRHHICDVLQDRIGQTTTIRQKSYDRLEILLPGAQQDDALNLAQNLSLDLNALTYQTGNQVISGAASISIRFL